MKMFSRIAIALVFALPIASPVHVFADFDFTPTVNVTDNCTANDGGSNSVSYSQPGQYLGICALVAAQQQGAVTSYTLTYDSGFGFFLASLNGIAPSGNQFWSLLKNGAESLVGLSSMTLTTDDTISFQLMQCSEDWSVCSASGSPVTFKIGTLTATPAPAPASSSGGSGLTLHAPFDVPQALAYLASVQSPDGSFGSRMLNDWVAIAAAVGTSGDMRTKLAAYEMAHPLVSTTVTENERHAMALLALGINPYSGTSVDYITPIVDSFDGTQIGDQSLVNDDIFAIFPLLHSGYEKNDPLITSAITYIQSKQHADGSWMGSVDLTAAAIQALRVMPDTGEVRHSISKATGWLRTKQFIDGSFGDPYSTSWMLQAIAAMNGTASDWLQRIYTPDYYLATLQDVDGGIMASSTNDRIWATSYAIPGIRRALWDSLLASFPKPVPVSPVVAAVLTVATGTPAYIADSGPAPQALKIVPESQTTPPAEPATTTSGTEQAQTASAAGAIDGINWNPVMFILFILALISLIAGIFAKLSRRE